MKYQVDAWNNFCRVFKLPKEYPKSYCFGGGKPVTMVMQDWFCPVQNMPQAAVSKEVYEKEVGPIKTIEVDGDELAEMISSWLQKKEYVEPDKSYLVICNFGLAFTFIGKTEVDSS